MHNSCFSFVPELRQKLAVVHLTTRAADAASVLRNDVILSKQALNHCYDLHSLREEALEFERRARDSELFEHLLEVDFRDEGVAQEVHHLEALQHRVVALLKLPQENPFQTRGTRLESSVQLTTVRCRTL